MYSFEEFVKMVVDEVSERILDKGTIIVCPINRAVETYTGMYINQTDVSATPVVNLDEAYKFYCSCPESANEDKIMEWIMNQLMQKPDDALLSAIDSLKGSYSSIKNRIVFRLHPGTVDTTNKPHRKIGDMVLLYYLQMDIGHTQISDELMEVWEVDEEQLYQDAMVSCPKHMPLMHKSIMDFMFYAAEEMGMELSENELKEKENAIGLSVVTNSQKAYGAGAILYPHVCEQLYEKLGESFIVIPSSIHEMLIFRESERYAKLGGSMLRTVNLTEVSPEERLSDYLYRYDRETNSLVMIDDPAYYLDHLDE